MKALLSFACAAALSIGADAADVVSIDVLVTDEAGNPVEGAAVRGFFFSDQIVERTQRASHRGTTGPDGAVQVSGAEDRAVDVTVTAPDYYESKKRVLVRDGNTRQTLILRRKLNPIEMYARRVVLNASGPRANGEEFGYDLMVGDFTAPHGKGQTADLLITNTFATTSPREFSWRIDVRFSNPEDGLVPFYREYLESAYNAAYLAPVDGYVGSWTVDQARAGAGTPTTGTADSSRNYYFRVRSRIGPDGTVSAYYGKIYGEFPAVAYYLNPDRDDRNVEADPLRNLLGQMSSRERVNVP